MKTLRTLRFAGLIVVVILAIGLSACERSKSQAPVTTAAPTGLGLTPTENLGVFETLTPVPGAPTTDVGAVPTATVALPSVNTPVAPAFTATSMVVLPAATATRTPVAIVPTPGKPATYTLQRGEFPYCIARRFDINPLNLLSYNGLTVNSEVKEGDVLKIPQDAPAFPAARALKAHPTQYTVVAGDTIYMIACEFGDVSPDMIALANGLSAPYTLTSGTVLQIP